MTDAPRLHPVPAKPFDASNPEQVRDRELENIRREKASREALISVLSTPGGRNWMWQLLERCNVFAQSFVPGDQHGTAFNEGQRSIGLEMMAQITRASPDLLVQLLKEGGKA